LIQPSPYLLTQSINH